MKPNHLKKFNLKAKVFTFLVIAAFWGTAIILPSCGKKDETTTTTQDTSKTNQQQTTQQQTTQQNQQQQTQQQQTTKKDSVKTDDKKKEDEKKKEEEKKRLEDEKKMDEVQTTKVDFAAIWPKKCAKCHGKDGKGKVEGVPDLTSGDVKGASNNKLKQIIEDGKKGKTDDDEDMPSFKGKLTPEEIDAAVKYVKGL